MMPEQQKRNIKVNVYLNQKEEELIEQYLSKQLIYQPVSSIFRSVLMEKIKNETKDQS